MRGQVDVFRHPNQTPIATDYFLALQCHKSIKEGREKTWVGCAHGISSEEVDALLTQNMPWQKALGYDEKEDRIVDLIIFVEFSNRDLRFPKLHENHKIADFNS